MTPIPHTGPTAMNLKKCLVCRTVLYLIIGAGADTKSGCTGMITRKLVNDFYCPADTGTIKLANVPLHVCTHYCISESQCPVLTYHPNRSLCLVHKDICVEMVRGAEQVFSSIILFWPRKQDCISWKPYLGNVPDSARIVHMDGGGRIVVRLHHNNEILPGRFDKAQNQVKTVSLVSNSININMEEPEFLVEFLVVSDTCSIAWVPHMAGNRMPSRAVVGGRKENGGLLFFTSLWTTNRGGKREFLYGYFDPETQLGYTLNSGVASNSSVNIMVEN